MFVDLACKIVEVWYNRIVNRIVKVDIRVISRQFDGGKQTGYFDAENPDKVVTRGKYYKEYDDCVGIAESENSGKVVINLSTDDLQREYDRIAGLGIGNCITEIKYINAKTPYYYFSLKDPDDNTIEITGPYDENSERWI